MLKQNKGITLVALVITIIVLLILAGVSISLVVGDNGVLTQSQSAAKKTDAASADNAVQLTVSSLNTKFMGEKWVNNVNADIREEISASDFATELGKNGYTVTNSATYTSTTDMDGSTDAKRVQYTIKSSTNSSSPATTYTFYLTAKKTNSTDTNFTSFSATRITQADTN